MKFKVMLLSVSVFFVTNAFTIGSYNTIKDLTIINNVPNSSIMVKFAGSNRLVYSAEIVSAENRALPNQVTIENKSYPKSFKQVQITVIGMKGKMRFAYDKIASQPITISVYVANPHDGIIAVKNVATDEIIKSGTFE